MNQLAFRDTSVLQTGRRYAIAIVCTLLTIWVRNLLHPWLHEECPFSLFYLSVLLTAWLAGTGPAFLAIVLGTFSAAYFFIVPQSSFAIDSLSEFVQLTNYVIVNCVATILFSRLNRQRSLAEQRSVDNEKLSHSLRLADERKDEFLALLAHELRNPLAPIRTGLVMLNRESGLTPSVQRVKHIIERQTNHLVRITDDLLDVSRFTRGRVVLQIARIDLRDAINDAIEMIQPLIDEKSHIFHKLLSARAVWIDGDRLRLAQIVANLLGNAAKYTPSGGRIILETDEEDSKVSINIRDNGIGFAAECAEQLTQPFVQMDTSRTRDYGGLGLGLAIVDRLAKLHGGTLQASSRGVGMGSCFTVRLPVVTTTMDEDVASSQIQDEPDYHSPFGHMPDLPTNPTNRVLLVEDSADARELLAELLTGDGFDVVTAHDGVTALQRIAVQMPDVCVVDIGLPGLDGLEFARRMRRNESAKHVQLIAVTGWGSDADLQRSREAGFDIHMTKPIVYGELLERIEPGLRVEASIACK